MLKKSNYKHLPIFGQNSHALIWAWPNIRLDIGCSSKITVLVDFSGKNRQGRTKSMLKKSDGKHLLIFGQNSHGQKGRGHFWHVAQLFSLASKTKFVLGVKMSKFAKSQRLFTICRYGVKNVHNPLDYQALQSMQYTRWWLSVGPAVRCRSSGH